MPKKFVKRSKPAGKPVARKGAKVPGKSAPGKGRPTKGPYSKDAGKRPEGKRVYRKRPPVLAPGAAESPRRTEGDRLQKVLAASGVASRRECEELILAGRVHVDGKIASELGVRVDLSKQTVQLDGEVLSLSRPVYFAVNKPTGVVCTARDPAGRPRVTDLLPPSVGRVFAVGRLDMASEGLILVTNDGELANRLTHPRHGVEKLYHVKVAGVPSPEVLQEVRKGVYLDEGRVAFANVKLKSSKKNSSILEVVLDEGRNREIRRVLARVGHKVQKLQRIAVGPVRLGEMPMGAYRPLTREEVTALREATRPVRKTVTGDKPAYGAKPQRKRPPHAGGAPKSRKPEARPATGRAVIGADAEIAPAPTAKPASKPRYTDRKAAGSRPGAPKRPGARPSKHAADRKPAIKRKPRGGAPGGGKPRKPKGNP